MVGEVVEVSSDVWPDVVCLCPPLTGVSEDAFRLVLAINIHVTNVLPTMMQYQWLQHLHTQRPQTCPRHDL